MAVVTLKSGVITNRDATPVVLTEPYISQGTVREACGFVSPANGDSIASIYIFCQVPSNARVASLKVSCSAITSGAGDIGVYRTTAAGGAVVDVDFFATALSIASALNNSEQLNESTTNTVAKQHQELWEALGMSSDPKDMLDIAMTLTAATTASGTIGMKVQYVQQ